MIAKPDTYLYNLELKSRADLNFFLRPKCSWNFQDCKIAVWKDTQTPNLLPKFVFTTLKIALYFEHFQKYNLKPIIIPCTEHLNVAPKTENFRILRYFQPFPKYWQFSCFHIFLQS